MNDNTRMAEWKKRLPKGKTVVLILVVAAILLYILLFGYNRRGVRFEGLIEMQRQQNERVLRENQHENARDASERLTEMQQSSGYLPPEVTIDREKLDSKIRERLFDSGALESQSDGEDSQSDAGGQSDAEGVDGDSEAPTEELPEE